jgi:hypothetical protein
MGVTRLVMIMLVGLSGKCTVQERTHHQEPSNEYPGESSSKEVD